MGAHPTAAADDGVRVLCYAPQRMRAVRIAEPTGPQGLRLGDGPDVVAGPGQLKVRVRATALNRADLLQTRGLYPAPAGAPPDVPGLEYAGEVLAVGEGVTRFQPGDSVLGLVGGGAWAEHLITHEREAMAMPAGLSFVEAAAIPEAFITAWDALVRQAGLQLGQRVLLHAVASGVGTAALQLTRAWGATAVGTGRTAAKLERARALGLEASVLVPPGEPAFSAAVREALQGGADVALDLVGGAWLSETVAALADGGTLMLVGLVAGAKAQLPLGAVLTKRLRLIGTTLRARPLEEKIAVARGFERQVLPRFASGQLRPVIDAVLPMHDVAAGLERLASNATFGKLILTW